MGTCSFGSEGKSRKMNSTPQFEVSNICPLHNITVLKQTLKFAGVQFSYTLQSPVLMILGTATGLHPGN